MYPYKHVNNAYEYYMSDLSARVVAESGRPEDRYHLGKLILRSLKDDPDHIQQIDGGTGESETNKSVLERSAECARAFKALGLRHGDVIVLMAPNHLDLAIPYYAALFTGVVIAPIDEKLRKNELQDLFVMDKPKLVFCQYERIDVVQWALKKANVEGEILVVFSEKGEEEPAPKKNYINFNELLKIYGYILYPHMEQLNTDGNIESFKASDFDPEDTAAIMISTSGTTGLPKQATLTHKNLVVSNFCLWARHTNFPTPTARALVLSPLQWLSAIMMYNCSALLRITRVQTSQPVDQNHIYHLFKTYKPTLAIMSPTMLTSLMKPGDEEKCGFSCLDTMFVGGSAVSESLVSEAKKMSPNTAVMNTYGLSEIGNMAFIWDNSPAASSGRIAPHLQHRLVDPATNEFILEPNVRGELWLRGPSVFKGYYRNPEATADAFAKDDEDNVWFKTGDMFYRDEHWNFFFVERIKLLLKYNNHQISPAEIQNVIRQHPGVLDVAVTGIPDPECGDLPVACIVRRPGHDVTAQEIKDLVRDSLVVTKWLRGGVVFLDNLPVTATTKVNYRRLKEIVSQMNRE